MRGENISVNGQIQEYLKVDIPYKEEEKIPVQNDTTVKSVHKKRKHFDSANEGKKPFMCSKCNKSFYPKSKLTKHFLAVHEKIKPYHCSNCESKFAYKPNLITHIKKIHGEEQFAISELIECMVCKSIFKNKKEL